MTESRADVPYGVLDLFVLKTLDAMGPLHGFGLARRIEQTSGQRLQINQGSIYPALLRLEQNGWIFARRAAVVAWRLPAGLRGLATAGAGSLSDRGVGFTPVTPHRTRPAADGEDHLCHAPTVRDPRRSADPGPWISPHGCSSASITEPSRSQRAPASEPDFSSARHRSPGTGAPISPTYFATLGVPILDGRDFADTDTLETTPVAILSQRAGELLFQGEYPLGQQVRWGVDPYFWATVIGIVPNTTWHQADDGGVEYYFHHGQFPAETMRFLISTRNDPALLETSVRLTLESVNPNFVVERVVPFERIAYEALWQRRLQTFLFLVFGTVAVILTSVGLFAVMS